MRDPFVQAQTTGSMGDCSGLSKACIFHGAGEHSPRGAKNTILVNDSNKVLSNDGDHLALYFAVNFRNYSSRIVAGNILERSKSCTENFTR
jgi:hypothetical protein